jgi:Acyl-CoA carboxylase epsilon subunit
VSNENGSQPTEAAPQPHEPHIQILKGRPTDEELAALVAVLGGVGGGIPEPTEPELTRWGLAVDRLRFAMSNYQRLTMQQMMHLKH